MGSEMCIRDSSHSLKKRIKALEGQVCRGDTSDAVLSQLADFSRRLGELESAASRISGGQSTISTVARLRDQLTYVGRWVHALCEQVWDIQRYTRRRSLHVVSFVMPFHVFSVYHSLSFSLISFQSGKSIVREGSTSSQIVDTLGSLAAVDLSCQLQDSHFSGRDKFALQVCVVFLSVCAF